MGFLSGLGLNPNAFRSGVAYGQQRRLRYDMETEPLAPPPSGLDTTGQNQAFESAESVASPPTAGVSDGGVEPRNWVSATTGIDSSAAYYGSPESVTLPPTAGVSDGGVEPRNWVSGGGFDVKTIGAKELYELWGLLKENPDVRDLPAAVEWFKEEGYNYHKLYKDGARVPSINKLLDLYREATRTTTTQPNNNPNTGVPGADVPTSQVLSIPTRRTVYKDNSAAAQQKRDLTQQNVQKAAQRRIEALSSVIDTHDVQKVIARAIELGVDPAVAVSIMALESNYGRVTSDSPKGAKGIMQVMPSTVTEQKNWWTKPEQKTRFPKLYEVALSLDVDDNSTYVDAGLLLLRYEEQLGLSKNLWGAGYQSNAYKVNKLGTPRPVGDDITSNQDYNDAYVRIYNAIVEGGFVNGFDYTAGTEPVQNQPVISTPPQTSDDVTVSEPVQNQPVISTPPQPIAGVDSSSQFVQNNHSNPLSNNSPDFITPHAGNIGQENVGISQQQPARQWEDRLESPPPMSGSMRDAMAQLQRLRYRAEIHAGNPEGYQHRQAYNMGIIKIRVLQGQQAIYDLQRGNGARAAVLIKYYSGEDIKVIPTDNKSYIIRSGSGNSRVVTANQLTGWLKSRFDAESTAAELAMKVKANAAQTKAIQEIIAYQIKKDYENKYKTGITQGSGDGEFIIRRGPNFYRIKLDGDDIIIDGKEIILDEVTDLTAILPSSG